MKSILLVEDDKSLNQGITLKLKKEGYRVSSAFSLEEAEELFASAAWDLLICDVGLPDGSGLDFCRRVRQVSDVFILFLTALDSEIDMVTAYDLGADDYMTKPFSLMVLVSKVHAFMRRAKETPATRIRSGDILLSLREMKASRQGQDGEEEPILLSKKELQLLLLLMENACQILTKEQILERVWGAEGQFVDDNTVSVNISRLRGKIGGSYIQNVRGIGYIWTEESFRE
ncbi:response regulator transcription factor [Faecalicatena contorta]|uniref:response regulator transcription factor n=1 Tax=Faecalicatena contorta TaxID=39482 RepID=UPI00174A9F3D|nr:response regulator transcription factor [Faecalicatena contorta]MBM6686510.1 response regulator transcription factor [Faecalicatena contorta]MBM6711860.1 response regulator transcription factor [Faecalicatena contorta]